jgi:hypothetical protein
MKPRRRQSKCYKVVYPTLWFLRDQRKETDKLAVVVVVVVVVVVLVVVLQQEEGEEEDDNDCDFDDDISAVLFAQYVHY